jgi:hypothetical protein
MVTYVCSTSDTPGSANAALRNGPRSVAARSVVVLAMYVRSSNSALVFEVRKTKEYWPARWASRSKMWCACTAATAPAAAVLDAESWMWA